MPEEFTKKIVVIYAEAVPQKGGGILYQPIRIMDTDEPITVAAAAKIIGKSERTVQRLCDEGYLKSARRPGTGKKSPYQISKQEVLALLLPPAN